MCRLLLSEGADRSAVMTYSTVKELPMSVLEAHPYPSPGVYCFPRDNGLHVLLFDV